MEETLEMYADELDDMLEFLDELRESGKTNMFGATPYLQDHFPELTQEEAGHILLYWIRTFGDRHRGVSGDDSD